jgi:hypothetical protein
MTQSPSERYSYLPRIPRWCGPELFIYLFSANAILDAGSGQFNMAGAHFVAALMAYNWLLSRRLEETLRKLNDLFVVHMNLMYRRLQVYEKALKETFTEL